MSSASSSITPPLLEALMSPDGSIRSQAEAVFQSLSVVDRIQGLLTHLSSSTSTPGGANGKTHPTTLLAAVLLRRTIVKLDEPGLLQDLVTPLLQAFRSMAMLPLAHCLAQVCASLTLVQPDAVAGVLTTILSTIQAPIQDVGHVPSLQLMAALADQAPVAFAHVAVGSLPHLYTSSGLGLGLGGGGGWSPAALAVWTEVLVAAAIATTTNTTTTATTNLDEWVIDPTGPAAQLAPALEPLLPFLTDDSQDEDARHSVLQHLAHAAVACPSLLAGNPQILPALIQTCLQVATTAATRTHQESLSLAALQVLASLVSVGDVKRRCLTAEQAHAIASTAVPLCVHVMVAHAGDAEDDAAWLHEPATLVEDGMDDDESDEYLFASTLLESFVSQLDALAVLLPHAESLLPPQASDAASVRTGVAVLECALLATPVGLQPHLPVVLQAALTLANPSSSGSNTTTTTTLPPRIQYQALRLLGCLCATHPELTCTNRTVLERLTAGLASPISKVSATASLGLVSYCRSSSSNNAHDDVDFDDIANSLVPVLPEIVHALQYHPLSVTATDTGSIAMRVRAMGAVACVAQAVGPITAAFQPYYATLYPGLIASAQQAPTPELAAAALESATLVGQAVGVDVFGPDAHALLQHWILPALMKSQTQTQTNNHFNVEPLLLACARMASVLQEQFAPYLDSVLPLLLARVQEPPDVSIMEGDEGGLSPPSSSSSSSQQDSGTESMTVAVPGRGFTKVTINTTKIQEKAQATRAVYELAKAFSSSNSSDVSSFAKWVEPCLQAFLPLVSFAYSADVRSTVAQTLGAVFEVACAVGESSSVDGGSSSTSGMNLPQTYLPVLATAISNQLREEDTADMDNMYALADSLSEVYYIAYRYRNRHPDVVARFGLEQATVSVDCCRTVMVDCLDRRTQLLRVLQTGALGPDEAQDYTTELATEEQLLTPLVDSMGYLLKFMTGSDNDSSSVFVRDVFEPQYASLLQSRLSDQSDVRASLAALCLFDDVVEHGGPAAAQHYAPALVQGVVTCFQHHPHEPELIQAAVYGIVQLARHVPNAQTVLSSHLPTLLHQLLALTNTEKSESEGEPYACEMAAIALGSLTLWGPFPSPKGVSQSTLVEHVLAQCPILQAEDTDAQLCHAALCQLFETGVVDPTRYADRLVPIIGSLLQHVVQEGDPGVATPDTVERLSNLLFHLVSSGGQQVLLQGLSPEVQHVVGAVLNDVATSRSHVVTP